ncbi:hypothetical protein WICPIJ_000365 [Wickerhamomyces pijperi]|uniref:Band 7 domain-containing protein n=1 Tax=Wickerhamomyces pijperi TaxID=599730 RepID=A0A9P8QHA5_WICPI|nr:hypothetical protein WICPIJ_000365 [Wickerhamomyces pijperi]
MIHRDSKSKAPDLLTAFSTAREINNSSSDCLEESKMAEAMGLISVVTLNNPSKGRSSKGAVISALILATTTVLPSLTSTCPYSSPSVISGIYISLNQHIFHLVSTMLRTATTIIRPSFQKQALRSLAQFSTSNVSARSQLSYFQDQSLPANTVIRFVPQQTAWVVERMGKFNRILDPGLAILIPFLDKIQYVQSLKESAIEVPSQSAITSDNVTLEMDGVLYIKVVDAYKASYGVEDAEYAISQLAQTTMRSEIGQLTLDHVLRERASLNHNITTVLNEAAKDWGIECLRYEIKDIHPPSNVLEAMHRQVSAERSKRAEILESEGQRQSAINIAEGQKTSQILASEAQKAQSINEANGEAEAILLKAKATAEGIRAVAKAINETPGGTDAVSLQVAEKYVDAFGKIAKEGNSVVVPANLGDMGSLISGGLGIYGAVSKTVKGNEAASLKATNIPAQSNIIISSVMALVKEVLQIEILIIQIVLEIPQGSKPTKGILIIIRIHVLIATGEHL